MQSRPAVPLSVLSFEVPLMMLVPAGQQDTSSPRLTATRWVPVVVFPRAVLNVLVVRFLKMGPAVAADLVADAAGEFANVIAGQAKTILKGTDYHFTLSTPTVGPAADLPDALVLPFDTDAGPFALHVALAPCNA